MCYYWDIYVWTNSVGPDQTVSKEGLICLPFNLPLLDAFLHYKCKYIGTSVARTPRLLTYHGCFGLVPGKKWVKSHHTADLDFLFHTEKWYIVCTH